MTLDKYIDFHVLTLQKVRDLQDKIQLLESLIVECVQRVGRIYLVGNGGSASTASHFATDLSKGVFYSSGMPVKAYCLNDNVSLATAAANDFSFEDSYTKLCEIFVEKKDLIIVISGSGNSVNIVNTILWANLNEISNFALLGFDGGKVKELSDNALVIPCNDMQIVENLHLFICHWIFKVLSQK